MSSTPKSLIGIIFAIALASFAVACGSDDSTSDPSAGSSSNATTSAQKQPTSLTSCADFTDPPFNYVGGSEKKGFDPDFLRAVTSAMDSSLKMNDTRFASLIAGLRAGRCDAVVSFMYVTPERAKTVDFVPYAESGLGFLVRKDSGFQPQELVDLCGKKVSMLQGSVQETLSLPTGRLGKECKGRGEPIEVKSLPTGAAAVQELITGRVDSFFMDNAGAVAFAKQFKDKNLVVSNQRLLDPVVAGIAVRKDDAARKAWFVQGIEKLKASGELDRLYKSYGLDPVGPGDFEAALEGRPVEASAS